MPRGFCVTPLFKNTSRLVFGKPDERLVLFFFFNPFCFSAPKHEKNSLVHEFLYVDFFFILVVNLSVWS